MFVEYNSTRRKKERTVSAESATRDNGRRDGREEAERVLHDATENRTENKSVGGQRATKRENGTGGTQTPEGRRATKRENDTDEEETSSG